MSTMVENSYLLQENDQPEKEAKRLDDWHAAISEYLGFQLSLVNLEDTTVSTILELGCGSGAWAIQAATQFPQARVVAVDIQPPYRRTMPKNVTFQIHDITQPFPFAAQSFDIVHARLVLMHVPNGEDVLRRAIELLNPGGWLLVEEPDDGNATDGGNPLGPGMTAFLRLAHSMIRSKGAEPCIGRELGKIVKATEVFSDIRIKRITIPVSEQSEDDELNKLGRAWRDTSIQVAYGLEERMHGSGFSHDIVKAHLDELIDSNRKITTDMYFVSCRKNA